MREVHLFNEREWVWGLLLGFYFHSLFLTVCANIFFFSLVSVLWHFKLCSIHAARKSLYLKQKSDMPFYLSDDAIVPLANTRFAYVVRSIQIHRHEIIESCIHWPFATCCCCFFFYFISFHLSLVFTSLQLDLRIVNKRCTWLNVTENLFSP